MDLNELMRALNPESGEPDKELQSEALLGVLSALGGGDADDPEAGLENFLVKILQEGASQPSSLPSGTSRIDLSALAGALQEGQAAPAGEPAKEEAGARLDLSELLQDPEIEKKLVQILQERFRMSRPMAEMIAGGILERLKGKKTARRRKKPSSAAAKPKTASKPKSTSKPKTTAKPKPSAKPKTTTKPKTTAKPKTAAKPKTSSKPKSTAKPKTAAKPKTSSKPKSTAKPKTAAKPKAASKPKSASKPKTTPSASSKPKSG